MVATIALRSLSRWGNVSGSFSINNALRLVSSTLRCLLMFARFSSAADREFSRSASGWAHYTKTSKTVR